jgi:anti-anti-sigma regulatory factor
MTVAKELAAGTRCLLLDASAITHIDSTGAAALDSVAQTLAERNIAFAIADLGDESRGILDRAGVLRTIGTHNLFNDREEALRSLPGEVSQTSDAASASGEL